MNSKPKLIAGIWSAAGGTAAFAVYRRQRDFEKNTPCVHDVFGKVAASEKARDILGLGNLHLARWPLRWSKVDLDTGCSTARFWLQGENGAAAQVLMTARKRSINSGSLEESFEELDAQPGGWRAFLSRPWELKLWLSEKVRSLRGGAGANAAGKDDLSSWYVDTLAIIPAVPRNSSCDVQVLLGDVRGIPDYETYFVRKDADAKDSYSRRRLNYFIAAALAVAVTAGGVRFFRSMGVSRGYTYAQQALLAHPTVQDVMGSTARIQTSTGTFGAGYVNSKLRFVSEGDRVADVEFAAVKDPGGRSQWRVVLAKMNTGGRIYTLDKAKF